ncbi:MAG: hypothetical protein EA427_13875 [Spirochaetaceae bacterium]|nr:MAG: hypothetical protein EA427_13875 [Spirochaetaceae bacterium]
MMHAADDRPVRAPVSRPVRGLARLLVPVLLMTAVVPLASQVIDMDAARAREEFRWGVDAYHATRFNDAIIAFNRALALTPEDYTIREWLGRAYFRSGFEDAAVNEWDIILSNDAGGAYLRSRVDTIRYRRGIMPFREDALLFSRSSIIRGDGAQGLDFHRPTGIAVEPNGDIFLVSLGSQEVLRITPNGRVRRILRGGLQGLNRPFDVAWYRGEIYVTEFAANRIAVLDEQGNRVRQISERGLREGQLLGPQYVTVRDERVFVTDWGGRKVSVFAPDGEFILSFGRETHGFPGLQRPTGIAVSGNGRVYVAEHDRAGPALIVFDQAGNFLERIGLPLGEDDVPENSVAPVVIEGLAWYEDDHQLLITAGTRTLVYDLGNRSILAVIDDAERLRVGAAALDANGRVVMSDIDSSELGIFEPEGTLYSGLDIQIERILSSRFPNVAMLVSVHDRDGRPLVGLSRENFIISEAGIPQPDFRIESAGQFVRELDVSAVVQARPGTTYREDAAQALFDIATLLPGGQELHLYAAREEPALLIRRPATAERFAEQTRNALIDGGDDFARNAEPLDRALRLAATPLLDRSLRRHMIVIGDGRVTDSAFEDYGIQEMAAYLLNNDIRMHYVLLERRTPAAEIRFLADETGGEIRYLYEPEGLAPMIEGFLLYPSGRYWLTYASSAFPDFGRAYLAVSAEVNLFVRSGRDELGFFPPPEP